MTTLFLTPGTINVSGALKGEVTPKAKENVIITASDNTRAMVRGSKIKILNKGRKIIHSKDDSIQFSNLEWLRIGGQILKMSA